MMLNQSWIPVAILGLVLSGSSACFCQNVQFNASQSPFHNANGNQNLNPGYSPNTGPVGPGTLSIPQIMPVKRPLPRKPVQPVFVMKGIDLGADRSVQAIDKKMRSYSSLLLQARKTRNNRLAMQYVRKMEQARQQLLRHLREVAPVKKSFAPLPEAKSLPSLPPVNPAVEEMPILPMPKMPGSKKNK